MLAWKKNTEWLIRNRTWITSYNYSRYTTNTNNSKSTAIFTLKNYRVVDGHSITILFSPTGWSLSFPTGLMISSKKKFVRYLNLIHSLISIRELSITSPYPIYWLLLPLLPLLSCFSSWRTLVRVISSWRFNLRKCKRQMASRHRWDRNLSCVSKTASRNVNDLPMFYQPSGQPRNGEITMTIYMMARTMDLR